MALRRTESAAEAALCDAVSWLRDNYLSFRFFTERDVVWTIQTRLREQFEHSGRVMRVFNDHPALPGHRRALSADLAVINGADAILAMVEFKFEPAHMRRDILKNKFPVIGWRDVVRDHERVNKIVATGRAPLAVSILVDEGGNFRGRDLPERSVWQDWPEVDIDGANPSILIHKARRSS